MRQPYIIWGATGQSIMIHDTLHETHELIAVFDNNSSISSPFKNIPVFHGKAGYEKWKSTIKNIANVGFVVGIGGGNGKIRTEVHDWLKSEGLTPLSVINRSAYIGLDCEIGEGCQILPNATLAPRVKLGKAVIINCSASVDHECELEDGVHIGPGAKLAGCIHVGVNSFIGTNATVLPRIMIDNNVVVGAGSVVTKNIPSNLVVYGNPARVKK